jgi:hypothetical protein
MAAKRMQFSIVHILPPESDFLIGLSIHARARVEVLKLGEQI